MFRVRMLEEATADLGRLDKSVARRLVARIQWLAANLADIKPEALKAELAGLYKLRMGDYRVIYEILHKEEVILVHFLGHRSRVYRRR